jgi:hypothetical protein
MRIDFGGREFAILCPNQRTQRVTIVNTTVLAIDFFTTCLLFNKFPRLTKSY